MKLRYRSALMLVPLATLACGASATSPSPTPAQQVEYRDPGGRFTFSYPQSFGTTSVGTDNGFENRVAAIRFSVFSAQGNGGEAVLGQGRPSLDVLAAGGLYDDIASGTLPAPIKSAVDAALPPLTLANVCDQLGRQQHVDVSASAFASLTPQQRDALVSLDGMGNIAPRIFRCTVTGDTVTFDKEAAVVAGGPRRHTYGAVRFLTGRFSNFQLIRATPTADQTMVNEMLTLVTSWTAQ